MKRNSFRRTLEPSESNREIRTIFALLLPPEALLWIQYVTCFVKVGFIQRCLLLKISIDFRDQIALKSLVSN